MKETIIVTMGDKQVDIDKKLYETVKNRLVVYDEEDLVHGASCYFHRERGTTDEEVLSIHSVDEIREAAESDMKQRLKLAGIKYE